MINDLKLIVNFLDKAKVSHLEIFTREDFSENPSKMGQLFKLVKNSDVATIDDLKQHLYQISEKEWGLKKLLLRFKQKLSNTLFLVDTNSPLFTERTKAYYNCSKKMIAARLIHDRGAGHLAYEMAEQAYEIATKYEFTDIRLYIVKYLQRRISVTGDFQKFKKYFDLSEEISNLYFEENELEHYRNFIAYSNNTNNKRSISKFNLFDKKYFIQKAYRNINEKSSIDLINYSSSIITNELLEARKFNEYKIISSTLFELIEKKPFFSSIAYEGVLVNLLKVDLITKDYENAVKLEKNYFAKINAGAFNWFVCYFVFILILLHCKKYAQANLNLNLVMNNKLFKAQPPIITEQFIIIQAYLYFIENLNTKTLSKSGEFRISKFLNQVPEYSKDKEGTNISILLIQILYFLKEDKYSKIIDRIESLKLYSYRHLRKDENFRSQCFFRMLNEMVKADFRIKGTEFRTEKLYKKLVSVPIETFPNAAEREVIPYEDLWELILGHLK